MDRIASSGMYGVLELGTCTGRVQGARVDRSGNRRGESLLVWKLRRVSRCIVAGVESTRLPGSRPSLMRG